jgi:hypothetical protein
VKDFTLQRYQEYLDAICSQTFPFYTFCNFMELREKPERFCLVRHDVDRKPANALNMAKLEYAMKVKATYYFRTKQETFKPDIIREIAGMGHEIGYHYESLSDTDGSIPLALEDFESNLERFRKIVPVKTISMHGRPLKPYDNRDIWRIPENHELLKSKFNLSGEVYLDIDYSDIAYINDTGRNWTSGESNRRDKVDSNISADFNSGEDLLRYLQGKPHPQIIFQIHPERWSDDLFDYCSQFAKDTFINAAKRIVR